MTRRTPIRAIARMGCAWGVALLGALHSMQPLAEIVPPRGIVDSRIRTAPYDSEQVYRLRGLVGYQIDLEFEPGETFVGLGAGDIEGLAFFGQDNHLFLKPKAARVSTNLTVLTNRRRYQFDYTAVPPRSVGDDRDAIFALRFVYRTHYRANACGCVGKAHRRRARRCIGEAAAEQRLLVLRQFDAQTGRGIR